MSDNVMKALDEIVDVLCKHLGPQVLNQDVASDIDIDRHDDFRSDMQEVAADILALPTLRAALAPGADDEVEAIRQRHTEMQEVYGEEAICPMGQRDRATLLAHVSRLSAELAAERERRVEVEGALKPFAAMVSNHPEMDAPSPVITLTYNKAHLRRAATLTKD